MSRGGKDKMRNDPERRCIVSGEAQPRRGLIRFAVSPDALLVADILEKLPGKGMWVSAERDALDEAVAKNHLSPPPRQKITISDRMVGEIERQPAKTVV